MKISEQWLRDWVNPSLSTDELVAQITMAGLEVESVTHVAGVFNGVVIAEIVKVEQHPDADKLRVCQVNIQQENTVQVVCGAANARVGIKVPFAQVGAELPNGLAIKQAKLRGIESFGMLCGASELGMEDNIDGLMELSLDAPIGIDIRKYLQLDDKVLEVDLTPNRGDCLSVMGLSREIATLNKLAVNLPDFVAVAAQIDDVFPIQLEAALDCPRYAGRVIRAIDIKAPTPLWMTERLRRSGIRSIDAVVDVTNYVMLELGQPMHAFDLAQLDKKIIVRKSLVDETLTLLDGQELSVKPDSLVIADNSKVLALAGIMGGKQSGVNEDTQDIVLEAAFFAQLPIAGKARSYGLHTDSSHRFERGVDHGQQVRAIERATALLLDITGGKPGPVYVASNDVDLNRKTSLSKKRLEQVLGLPLAEALVTDIFTRLGIQSSFVDDTWYCDVPSYRFDITIEADLIEEVARIYGYNNLPTRSLRVPVSFKARSESTTNLQRVKHQLLALGYQEAITYSFIEPKLQALFSNETPIAVQNPISTDMSVMRTSLLPGLVSALVHNANRQQNRIRLFETGLQFHQVGTEIVQKKFIAGLIYGARDQESWANAAAVVDFYDIKGDVESILASCLKRNISFIMTQHTALHPGQSATLVENGEEIGIVGALHPEVIKKLGISGSIYVFELSLEGLLEGNVPKFKALSKFPQVRRDLALLVDQTVLCQQIVDIAKANAGEWQQSCVVFDVYSGQGVESGKKSVAVGLTFQHSERNLQDEEIQVIMENIVKSLDVNLGAVLRK